ncbi:MAG: Ig-like domain-containing protein [Myxococcales bacterium]|nr:Ig-like domain-containing protein [Myxococcales bacterium]
MLAVLVMNDAAGHLIESATYCKVGDEKRPARVGLPDFTAPDVCPPDVSKSAEEIVNAYPDGWYVRIMFDELLDPNIEELIEIEDPETGEGTDTYTGTIANTHPVKLECESVGGGFVEVEYDGYYSPAGNAVTWPLGPSLVILPNDPTEVATGKQCRVTINDNVTDKQGNKVPMAQRGPFTFKIAPIQVVLIDPADDAEAHSPVDGQQIYFDNFYVQFNTDIDESSMCDEGAGMDECEFSIGPEDTGHCSTGGEYCIVNGPACPTAGDTCEPRGYYAYNLGPFGLTFTETGWGPDAPLQSDKAYTFGFKQGTKLKDRCGVETTFGAPSPDDQTQVRFTTNKFAAKTANIGSGDLVSAMKKLSLPFTNPIDFATIDAADYTFTPTPVAAPGGDPLITTTEADMFFAGHYQLNTEYTFTLKAGAKIKDVYGAEYTVPADKTVKWKTQPAITMTSSPANEATVTKATPTSVVGVTLTFNQAMDATTLTAGTDYTFKDAMGADVVATPAVGAAPNACAINSTGCQLRIRANLAPGVYTFTLKAGAMISANAALVGESFTNAADKVIKFTVKNADPVSPHVCL